MAGNPNYDEILATTLANHAPTMIDNVFTARPFAFFMKRAGQIEEQGGGHKVVVPLMYEENSTFSSYSGSDVLNTDEQGGITAVEYDWRQAAVSVSINGLDEAKNSGEEQIISLLKARIDQAEQTAIERFDYMWLTGDGTGNGGKDWLGLPALIGDQSSTITTVGNISATTNSWWRSNRFNGAGALALAGAVGMNRAYNTAAEGNDQPQFVLTTQILYEAYEALLQPNMRYENSEVGDAGFLNLMFKKAPVLFDRYVTAGVMYFLNPKYLKLVVMRGKWMSPTKFKEPTNQDIRVAQILCYGQLTVTNRERHSWIYGLTNT
jgi:hypothetical protein